MTNAELEKDDLELVPSQGASMTNEHPPFVTGAAQSEEEFQKLMSRERNTRVKTELDEQAQAFMETVAAYGKGIKNEQRPFVPGKELPELEFKKVMHRATNVRLRADAIRNANAKMAVRKMVAGAVAASSSQERVVKMEPQPFLPATVKKEEQFKKEGGIKMEPQPFVPATALSEDQLKALMTRATNVRLKADAARKAKARRTVEKMVAGAVAASSSKNGDVKMEPTPFVPQTVITAEQLQALKSRATNAAKRAHQEIAANDNNPVVNNPNDAKRVKRR